MRNGRFCKVGNAETIVVKTLCHCITEEDRIRQVKEKLSKISFK